MTAKGLGDKTICQICLIVDDVEKYGKKYAEVFGFELPDQYYYAEGYDQSRATYYGERTEARAKIVSFNMGDLQFELLQPLGGPSVWKDFLDQHGPGIHHIAFQVTDTDKVTASFGMYGFEVSQQGLFSGTPSGMYTYLTTEKALGITVELLEILGDK